ncbi:hypothetical protein [Streptomyces paradoxus]|uniref:hypothetical protein n=1 Tax=Streptomyces paradoxus TaxID=66375 RepID=UPI0037CE26C2
MRAEDRHHTTRGLLLPAIAEGLPSDTSPSGRWWVDVGLGDALYDPVPLVQGAYAQGPMRFGMEAVEPEGLGDWRLSHDPSGWFTGVLLVDRPVEMNVFTQRHVTDHTCESLPEWVDVLKSEFDLSFDDVPDEAMAALWTSVRRTHDEWLASRQSA